jgi:y4mF family transcriptional regulator
LDDLRATPAGDCESVVLSGWQTIVDGLVDEIERVIFESHSLDDRDGTIEFAELRGQKTSRFQQAREREAMAHLATPPAMIAFVGPREITSAAIRRALRSALSPRRDWPRLRAPVQASQFVPIGMFRSDLPALTHNRPDRFFFIAKGREPAMIVPIGMITQTITTSRNLGDLIRDERKAQGLTQEQLAGLTGVGVRFVRELEAGKESCQLGRALQVAAALGLSLSVSSRRETTR